MYKDGILEARQTEYRKSKFNLIEQREKKQMTLRKEEIDDIILRKRLKTSNFSENNNYYFNCAHLLTREEYHKLDAKLLNVENSITNKFQLNYLNELELIFNTLNGDDANMLYSIYLTRIYMSLDFPDFKLLVSKDLINILIYKLETISDEQIINEIYWIFSNLAFYGTNKEISILLNQDLIRIHSKFLEEKYDSIDLLNQILWTLKNIICDNIDFRNIFLTSPLLDNVINLFNYSSKQNISKTMKAILSLLYDCLELEHIPSNDESLLTSIYKIFPILSYSINLIKDEETFIHCLWSLKIISGIDDAINPSYIPDMFMADNGRLIKFLLTFNFDDNRSNLMQVIRIFGNLLSCEEHEYIDTLLSYELFNFFETILKKEKHKNFKKATAWAISNIAGGNYSHKKRVIESSLFAYITAMASDYDFVTRKEALYALYSLCLDINITLSIELAKKEIFKVFMKVIDDNIDKTVILMALDSIDHILHTGILMKDLCSVNPLAKKFDEIGGANFLENLQKNPDNVIYEKAVYILEKYFSTNEVDYQELALGNSTENSYGKTFSFNDAGNTDLDKHGNMKSIDPNFNFFGPNGAVNSDNQYLEN